MNHEETDDHGARPAYGREKLGGKAAHAPTVEVTFGPGVAGQPHRHPGLIFGDVLEGEFVLALDEQPVQALKAGGDIRRAGEMDASDRDFLIK